MSHTPAPWEVRSGTVRRAGQREEINRYVIGLKTSTGGMYVAATVDGPFSGRIYDAKADASLISAAPDLLQAVREFLDLHWIEQQGRKNAEGKIIETRYVQCGCATCQIGRKALAKATGQRIVANTIVE